MLYFFGFIIPLAINIYSETRGNEWKLPLYVAYGLKALGLSTQCFFLYLEVPELEFNTLKEYFSDSWNYVDSTQIIFYTGRLILSMKETPDEYDTMKLTKNIFTIICLLQSILKLLQYIKYKE